MEITTQESGDRLVLALRGKLTGIDAGDRLEQTVAAFALNGRRAIAVDLSGASLIDAGGLGSLVGAYMASRRHGATLRLVGVPRRIRQFIEIARLASVLGLSDAEPAPARAATSSAAPRAQSPLASVSAKCVEPS